MDPILTVKVSDESVSLVYTRVDIYKVVWQLRGLTHLRLRIVIRPPNIRLLDPDSEIVSISQDIKTLVAWKIGSVTASTLVWLAQSSTNVHRRPTESITVSYQKVGFRR